MNVRFFKTPQQLEQWFEENHDQCDELWLAYFKKHTKKASVTWDESVAEALKYGWIDGIRKSIDEESYKIRFTPRRKNSIWSAKNIKTVKELIEKGLMKAPGLEKFNNRKEEKSRVYGYEQKKPELSAEYLRQFKRHSKAWEYFNKEAPYYKKVVTNWVMSAKREATRQRRLDTLIADSEQQQRIKGMRK